MKLKQTSKGCIFKTELCKVKKIKEKNHYQHSFLSLER